MKDIFRVFEYHGAEHKVVFNFESGQPVNVENAQEFITFHPRCGTSFLFVVVMLVDSMCLHADSVRWLRGQTDLPHRAAAASSSGCQL